MTTEIVEQHIPCEVCGSSDAKCNYADGHGYCYSCNHYFPKNKDFEDLTYTFEYLPWRGVAREVMQFYDVKTKIGPDGEPVSIGYKYPNDSYKVRSLKDKNFHSVGDISKAGLFGRDKFPAGSHKYVTITEGELDALSLYQVIRSPVVSIQSAGTGLRDCALDREWLASFERVYLAFDCDMAGLDATRNVARLFPYPKVYQVRFDAGHKDANEFVRVGKLNELLNIWSNARNYLPEEIKSSFEEFKKILSESPREGIPYPFPKLTEMTYGMHTGETVLITAQEGVGKTEVMHAIEYQLLTRTDDNVGCIFLEEPKHRHLQSLAGIRLERPAHLPDSGCTDDEIYRAVRDVVGRDDRLHLYNHFGSTDPDVLIETIRFLVTARDCRWILFDHLSMAVSSDTEVDERRSIDRICTELEMMVKNLNFGLFMVSHVNDLGQTRSSRWPSKVADTRIHCTRDMDSGSNVIQLMIKDKNRLAGRTGPAGAYAFNALTRQYSPVEEPANDNGVNHVRYPDPRAA